MRCSPEDDDGDGTPPSSKGPAGKGDREMATSGKGGNGRQGHKGMGRGGSNAAGLGAVRQHVFKVLCTDPLAANIIGSKGSTRAAIEDDTGCSVWISKRDEVYTSPPFRILVLHGDEPEQVLRALDSVVSNLVEVAGRERDPDSPLLGKEAGEFAFYVILPTMCTGKLIGTRGANIQALREKTGAKVFVENEIFEGHKSGRIVGTPAAIRLALQLMNDVVQDEANSDEFCAWAVLQPFRGSSAGGGSAGRHRREPRTRRRDSRDSERHSRRSRERSPRHRHDRSQVRDGPRPLPFGKLPEGTPVQCMELFSREFCDGDLDRNHAVSCTLPSSHMDLLFAGEGSYIAYLERRSGTRFNVNKADVEGYSNVMITGPLLSVYVAHMALMKTYHDQENERNAEQHQSSRVEALQSQLASLESQLREAQRSTTSGCARPPIGKGRRSS
mmetsp:Transcript_33460/g.77742  ORF Transcript_33460/g.77742 Transcript_33460/m.77742 type:complete len:443 (+) Transcript_33460:80-1408(+)